tara:strand:- start:586 stop:822 length:237 start_codon:yes stop_codon:yes gene_type:complete
VKFEISSAKAGAGVARLLAGATVASAAAANNPLLLIPEDSDAPSSRVTPVGSLNEARVIVDVTFRDCTFREVEVGTRV